MGGFLKRQYNMDMKDQKEEECACLSLFSTLSEVYDNLNDAHSSICIAQP